MADQRNLPIFRTSNSATVLTEEMEANPSRVYRDLETLFGKTKAICLKIAERPGPDAAVPPPGDQAI
ncbi:MAG: hypothetical protein V2B13_03730 [Pseudomonadota bacterium]